MLESWAESARECYERHNRTLRVAHEQNPQLGLAKTPREYLIQMYREHQTSSSMRQALLAYKLLEEPEVAQPFVPKSFWRFVECGAKSGQDWARWRLWRCAQRQKRKYHACTRLYCFVALGLEKSHQFDPRISTSSGARCHSTTRKRDEHGYPSR